MRYTSRTTNPGRPNCPKCGGYGYYTLELRPNDKGFGRAEKCTCWTLEEWRKPDGRAPGREEEHG